MGGIPSELHQVRRSNPGHERALLAEIEKIAVVHLNTFRDVPIAWLAVRYKVHLKALLA
jgi:hypothetical protein